MKKKIGNQRDKRNKRRKYINIYLFKLNDENNYTMIKTKTT